MALIQEDGYLLVDVRKGIATLVLLCQALHDRVIFGLPHRVWRPEMEILVYGADAGVADSGICQLRI